MALWVDTDFGFDDLWALLILRQRGIAIDGLSLVAGNAPLDQVCRNAFGAARVFGFDWPISVGAAQPIMRPPETAEKILGPHGIQSRGAHLPQGATPANTSPALAALTAKLATGQLQDILALGPLTNLALLFSRHPDLAQNIGRITWMGGSQGRGNQSQYAEFNALADPEALAILIDHNAPLRVVDLETCRKVTFSDLPPIQTDTSRGKLLSDLLGGYLDIALTSGRTAMAIYDPVAALAIFGLANFIFRPAHLAVTTEPSPEYGRTCIDFDAHANIEIATDIDAQVARNLCLDAITEEASRA